MANSDPPDDGGDDLTVTLRPPSGQNLANGNDLILNPSSSSNNNNNNKRMAKDSILNDNDTDKPSPPPTSTDHNDDDDDDKAVTVTITHLKRRLTLTNVVAMLLALTGHVAIFIAPGSILRMSGSVLSTFACWAVGSFLVYSLALCFAELGTVFPQAGGPYLYMSRVFGPFQGFMLAWGYVVLISGPFIAFAAHTTAIYVLTAVLNEDFCGSAYYDTAIWVLSSWVLVTLTFLNCNFFKLVTRAQTFLTGCKIAAIFIIIVGGIFALASDGTENYERPAANTNHEPGKIALALLYVIFSNGGWQAVTTLTEEVKDPARVLPKALHMTFFIYVSIVALTFAAYFVVLDLNQIASSDAVALLFCRYLWPPLGPIMSALVSLASIGALNVAMLGHSRMILAVARRGTLPGVLSTVHSRKLTPMAAIILIASYGIIMLTVGGTTKMMQFIGLYSLLMGFKMVTVLLYLRYTRPELHRPYKVPTMYPILQLFVCFGLTVLIIYQEPWWMCVGILIYLAGVPVYLVATYRRLQFKVVLAFVGKMTRTFQKCFQQVPS